MCPVPAAGMWNEGSEVFLPEQDKRQGGIPGPEKDKAKTDNKQGLRGQVRPSAGFLAPGDGHGRQAERDTAQARRIAPGSRAQQDGNVRQSEGETGQIPSQSGAGRTGTPMQNRLAGDTGRMPATGVRARTSDDAVAAGNADDRQRTRGTSGREPLATAAAAERPGSDTPEAVQQQNAPARAARRKAEQAWSKGIERQAEADDAGPKEAPRVRAAGTATGQLPAVNAQAGTRAGERTGSWRATMGSTETSLFSGAAVRAGVQQRVDRPNYNAFRKKKKRGFAPAHALGNLLYKLGFTAECQVLRLWRVLRDVMAFFAQLAGWLFGRLFGLVERSLRELWHDVTTPYRQFRRRRAQLIRVRNRARKRAARGDAGKTFLGVGVQNSLQFALTVAGVLLPAVAAFVLGFTVHNVVNMRYALAVEIDGKVLGYVADQSVVENAKGLLRDRIRLARDQQMSDWQLNPSYTIASTASYTTTQQLVNEILMAGSETSDAPVLATGLYVNEEPIAVTTEGEKLDLLLTGMLAAYKAEAPADAVVEFVDDVSYDDPESDALYLTSSIMEYDELVEMLTSNVADEVSYTTRGGEKLADIAHEHGITLEALLDRNPGLADKDGEYEPLDGTRVLISRAKPFLQVQTLVRVKSTEEIPYTTVRQDNDNLAKNVTRVLQEGQNGLREVWDDYAYVDGELVEKVRVDELTVVLQEPQDRILDVGTYDFQAAKPGETTLAYLWPVPASTWSYRGISKSHDGQDINAPTGTPILAAQSGMVSTAGWHWSFGWYIIIDHADGLRTLYAHCSALYVVQGQIVTQGEVIAAVGSTGRSTGPHLHFEVQIGWDPLNPLDYVSPPPGYSFGRR